MGELLYTRDLYILKRYLPQPSVFKPQVPDRPLTIRGTKALNIPPPINTEHPAISQTCRNAMLSLLYLSHQPLWQMPIFDDFPEHDLLSHFVDLYFEHFYPTFPIVHRPTFGSEDTPPILLLSVAAIGATFAGKEFHSLVVALDELVRRIITWAVSLLVDRVAATSKLTPESKRPEGEVRPIHAPSLPPLHCPSHCMRLKGDVPSLRDQQREPDHHATADEHASVKSICDG